MRFKVKRPMKIMKHSSSDLRNVQFNMSYFNFSSKIKCVSMAKKKM